MSLSCEVGHTFSSLEVSSKFSVFLYLVSSIVMWCSYHKSAIGGAFNLSQRKWCYQSSFPPLITWSLLYAALTHCCRLPLEPYFQYPLIVPLVRWTSVCFTLRLQIQNQCVVTTCTRYLHPCVGVFVCAICVMMAGAHYCLWSVFVSDYFAHFQKK